MKQPLLSEIIEHIADYNRKMYEYGKNVRTYGTGHELRIDQTHIIDYIGKHPNCRLCDIAAAADASLPTVSLQVKRMMKLGLVHKARSEQNQREIVLTLTEDGESIYKYHNDMDERWMKSFSETLSSFKENELHTISRFLNLLLDNNPNI